MATRLLQGVRKWEGSRDEEGYTTYKVTLRVQSDDATDGPDAVLDTPGLPLAGSLFSLSSGNDEWAYCTWRTSCKHVEREDDKFKNWDVECDFTSKPMTKYCREVRFEDPILEPQRVSGGFIKYTEEATLDRYGLPIYNSAKEAIRGPAVEFDKSRNTVKIEQNVLDLELELLGQMNDTLNALPLWGLPARCIKLSVGNWERKYYGSCYKYYTRSLEFEVNVKIDPVTGETVSGFDRDILDEGTKCLRGDWNRDPNSLTYGHFIVASGVTGAASSDYMRYKDWNGENSKVILDGHGKPIHDVYGTGSGTGGNLATSPGNILVEKYDESDFTLLGIPTEL